MNERNSKMELLGSAPIPKALLAMGLPTMIGMMINALYNLVDAYFVGGLGTSQMGAISVAFPLGQVVVGLGLLFGNGAASYISRLLGHGETETADRVASTALYSNISVGAVIIICTILFLRPILRLLGATESILPYAEIYAGIYVVSSIFNIFNVTMNNIVTSEGAAKTTMCGSGFHLRLTPGSRRRRNCHSHLPDRFHGSLSLLCVQKKECLQLQHKKMLLLIRNYVRNP